MDSGLAHLLFTGQPAVLQCTDQETYMDLQELRLILFDQVVAFLFIMVLCMLVCFCVP